MLTNYCWDEAKAASSRNLATRSSLDCSEVHFGVDVWAQNGARTTYPKRGGGGTNTGVAVAKLSELGLSVGIFAPAWSFEHFPGRGREIEKVVWEGENLPIGIECSCGDGITRHRPTPNFPIMRHARAFPAGSEKFLATNFTRSFTKHSIEQAVGASSNLRFYAQLGIQSVLPLPPQLARQVQQHKLSYRYEEHHDQTRLVIEAHGGVQKEVVTHSSLGSYLPLYNVNMPANGTLRLRVTFRQLLSVDGTLLSIYLRFSDGRQPHLLSFRGIKDESTVTTTIGSPSGVEKTLRLIELGVHFRGFSDKGIVDVLELSSIVIAPLGYHDRTPACGVDIGSFQRCDKGDNATVRLTWAYGHNNEEAMVHGVPFSPLTGPFSHFIVKLENTLIGRAYTLECIVPRDLVERLADKEVRVEITGISFDGRTLASKIAYIRMALR